MSEVRRRAAIGIFTTSADLDAVTSRLQRQGIDRYATFDVDSAALTSQQAEATPPLSAAVWSNLQARYPRALVLRVDLSGAREETIVARTLLESAAQSVQLHDL